MTGARLALRSLAWGFVWAGWTLGWPLLARMATERGWHVAAAGLPMSEWQPDMSALDVWLLRGLSPPAWFGWTALWAALGLAASAVAGVLAAADREGLARRSLGWSLRSGRSWVAMAAVTVGVLALGLLFRGSSAMWPVLGLAWLIVPIVFDWWALRPAVVEGPSMGSWSTMPQPTRRVFGGWLVIRAIAWAVEQLPLAAVVLTWLMRVFEVNWLMRRDEPQALRPVLGRMASLRFMAIWFAMGLRVLVWASLIAGPMLAVGSFSAFDMPSLFALARHFQQELPWVYRHAPEALSAFGQYWTVVAAFLMLPLTCAYALAEGRLAFLLQQEAPPGPAA